MNGSLGWVRSSGLVWATAGLVACGSSASSGAGGSAGAEAGGSAGESATAGGTSGGAEAGGNAAGGASTSAGAGASEPIGPHSISSGPSGTCAIGRAGRLACWGILPGMATAWVLPTGTFQSVVMTASVGVMRTTGELVGIISPNVSDDLSYVPPGKFASFGWNTGNVCGLDADGNATCVMSPTGAALRGDITAPADVKFAEVADGFNFACGIRLDNAELQ